jgi:hypothetical protein
LCRIERCCDVSAFAETHGFRIALPVPKLPLDKVGIRGTGCPPHRLPPKPRWQPVRPRHLPALPDNTFTFSKQIALHQAHNDLDNHPSGQAGAATASSRAASGPASTHDPNLKGEPRGVSPRVLLVLGWSTDSGRSHEVSGRPRRLSGLQPRASARRSCLHAEGVRFLSPGQRPGKGTAPRELPSLKGWDTACCVACPQIFPCR